MVKPLQLDRLPKAGRLRAVQFRRTTPGNFSRVCFPWTPEGKREPLDPKHPMAGARDTRSFPFHHGPSLTVHAFPKALLARYDPPNPEGPPFDPAPETPYGEDGRVIGNRKKINMSLVHVLSLKNLNKLPTVRNKIKNRLKNAVRLLITRDAAVETIGGKKELVTTETNDGEKWVLQNWTYVLIPKMEVYRMPLADLMESVSKALADVNSTALRAEGMWKDRPFRPPPPDYSDLANGRSVNKVSRIKALFEPYAKASAEAIDDGLLIDDNALVTNNSERVNVRLPPRSSSSDQAPDRRTAVSGIMFSKRPILKIPEETKRRSRQGQVTSQTPREYSMRCG